MPLDAVELHDGPPPVLLPYQQELLETTAFAAVVIYEKSRRIGISWAAAMAAVETSAADRSAKGMDTWYIGYNLDMAREFIDDCAFWARWLSAFAGEAAAVEEFVFKDGDGTDTRDIQAFRIAFASGFTIVALSSKPRSLRGKQGFVILDEAAFHDDLAELTKAAMALLIWGGRVWIISTHDGTDNPFNELIEECRAGKRPFKVLRTTFDDALQAGLYRRVCLKKGIAWTAAGEAAWADEIRSFYGDDAIEELDVVPRASSGVWLSRALIEACMDKARPVIAKAWDPEFTFLPEEERERQVAEWLAEEVDPLIAALDPTWPGFLGGDFGRTGDLSVLAPGQEEPGSKRLVVPFLLELRRCPFAQQRQIINHLVKHLPRWRSGAFDANGLGAQLAEEAAQKWGATRVEQVKPSVEWYRLAMPPVKARFEDRTILLPHDVDVMSDLRLVRLEGGVAKVPPNVRVRSARGGWRHGDAAVAIAMLEHATGMRAGPIEHAGTGEQRASTGAPGGDMPDMAGSFGNGMFGGGIDPDRGFGTAGGRPQPHGY